MGAPLRDAEFMKLVGLKESRNQLALLPAEIRKQAYGPIAKMAARIAQAAAAAAPVREPNAIPGYGGGALRKAIAGRASRQNLMGFIGITRGAIAVHRQSAVTLKPRVHVARYYGKDGKLHSKRYSRTLSALGRTQLQAAGGRLIQPTTYGHLMEFGTARGVAPRPFLRPAVFQQRTAFEAAMRGIAPDVIEALRQHGFSGGRAA